MENPATWGEAERIVEQCLQEDEDAKWRGICGLSLPRRITDALRDAGLLSSKDAESPEHRREPGPP